ncbi:MAG: hypothetical protein AAGC55_23580, partial [Myxococcota bacterium]
ERGHTCYDFMSGVSQYKKKLSTASRVLVTVRATHPRSLGGLALRGAHRGEHLARRVRDAIRDRRAARAGAADGQAGAGRGRSSGRTAKD